MKKSLAALLALILMMTVVFFGCGKKEEAENANNDGTSQTSATDNLNQNNAPLEGNGNATDATIAPGSTDVTGATNATASTDTTDATASTGTTDVTKPSKPDFSTSQPNSGNQQTPAPQSNSKIEKYRQIFASGTYSMTFVTVNDGVEDIPVDFACKNGNLRMGMSMEGIPATMIYIAENDTVYMLFEMLGKFYTELTEELMGEEIDFSEATENFVIPDDAVITQGTGTFEGKSVYTETITTSDGKISVFYFDSSDNLIGIEETEDGFTSLSKISNFSTSVDDSLFEIPKGYTYMDLSWLMSME